MSLPHRSLLLEADLTGADSLVTEFIDAFVKGAARRDIPVHCLSCNPATGRVRIAHSQWRLLLGPTDWTLLGHIGEQAAAKAKPKAFVWRGAECWDFVLRLPPF